MKRALFCVFLLFLVACMNESPPGKGFSQVSNCENTCFGQLRASSERIFDYYQRVAVEARATENKTYKSLYEYDADQGWRLDAFQNEKKTVDEIYAGEAERVYRILDERFGLARGNYTLACTTCSLGRGGFVNASGFGIEGVPFRVYYQYGHCSSGGSNCGWEGCIRTANAELFESVKKKWCGDLLSRVRSMSTYEFISDDTNETREKCFEGAFEERGSESLLSIRQISSGRTDRVEKGNLTCAA